MFKVGVGINYWDDPKGLIKILTNETVYDFIDTFFLIDGRYKNREDEAESPDWMLRGICEKFRKIHLVRLYDKLQIDKRNRYWELAEEYEMDFMIVLDSDEYITIEPDVFNDSLRTLVDRDEKCYPVRQSQQDIAITKRPRLFKGPWTFRHIQNTKPGRNISHGSLYEDYGKGVTEIVNQMYAWYKDNPNEDERGRNGIGGLFMYHDKDFRTKERVIADRIYYDENPKR